MNTKSEKSKRVLITGGAGFVGHHFVEHFLKNTDWDIVVFDRLNYAASGFDRLRDIKAFDNRRVSVLTVDFSQSISEGILKELGDIDYSLHIGAESHVDNSITNPKPFVRSNVEGTMNMLDLACHLRDHSSLKCFLYFSTDEVFGPAPEGVFYAEDSVHNPSNPYAATKSGGEMLVKAYRNTYQLPAVITRTMNIFGERQHPEKFIPMVIKKVLSGETVSIHANSDRTKAGSRFYIHARNVADGYLFLIDTLEKKPDAVINQDFHISGEKEVDNLEMAQFIASVLGKELKYELVDFHSSRPGHDLRYALDDSKIRNQGWNMPKGFEDSLEKSVRWMVSPEYKHWLDI